MKIGMNGWPNSDRDDLHEFARAVDARRRVLRARLLQLIFAARYVGRVDYDELMANVERIVAEVFPD